MGHRSRPTAAQQFAPADLLRGILVVSSFGFWAVMLGDLVSLELARQRGVDPETIEAIERFKEEMG